MEKNFDECLKMMLHHEGGFVNHPKDPGGITNFGVTNSLLRQSVRHHHTACSRRFRLKRHLKFESGGGYGRYARSRQLQVARDKGGAAQCEAW